MSAIENKKTVSTFIRGVFAGVDPELAVTLLADDCSWWMIGSLPTSGLYEGKQTIVEKVLSADGGQIQAGSKFVEQRTLIAEGDHVAAEWVGGFKTTSGFNYKNHYNVMFEVQDGKIKAIREYNDSLYLKEAFFS